MIFTTTWGVGWVKGSAPLTGVILCLILSVIIICSMQFVRRGGHFQIFYWTHLLFLPFYIVLIIHAAKFWKFVIGPLAILIFEKLYSLITRYSTKKGYTYLKSVTVEQSNVISLAIHRPPNFDFKPGDWVFINIPSIALYEWHPFTISSAPEEKDIIKFHIQAVGNWTKQVYNRYTNLENQNEYGVIVHRATCPEILSDAQYANIEIPQININPQSKKIKERIWLNGPFTSCARYIFDCQHVVLIGAGIGITPYASILSSLMAQFRASQIVCRHCNRRSYNADINERTLKKVDFIWVNRDVKSFEWFLSLLRGFENEQAAFLQDSDLNEKFLDTHLYFTAMKNDESIGSAPFDLVSKIYQEVKDVDIFTSLNAKTHVGRPNWDDVFRQLSSSQRQISVFFCGPSSMANSIREQCARHKFRFYKEKF
ncbi:unnamed protein product [Didymodactylos carnosus]|uniref:FAD-binding FR-type domain-containing protein n=1 Tax=Didymodactylos carnosus TaxID=1234261 RepID=A0A815PZZ4_9BILA|nr:unnamed protein product [Didymodactylos carnosus]CAF1456641.1 unnamed protein product [Didymodactylos carnosus]CAF4072242.1 unnamed protein product [Didymodactylos carnosus]CAF4328298.1 unnamed protein product [Didymodactylos carnosus]